ncbi:hypothetical protein M2164_008360 [Streptomyces sp. SAI-208]|uniref:hypothetical protein n=1 Tax=unclassified Streptomyces TaxID=2593676 RepID=UPI002476E437|nr:MULTISPECIES: hypothetical protein [unclassified Streptomyces]MDH6521656.1 hypothetical protein [Streptomyces sp. SAI-090]MDH6553946.1 hypothetical protein [Streptomyces sp. SAI-041]MDH6573024.1 hypothetical protein [Streptomyces sp. SAI-117]MDH6582014.1 hypothetical protein [Streptomyces sp. SAI-133]MDH6612725.1 hypothetical protein [Streptomyces sp. SAI-208]
MTTTVRRYGLTWTDPDGAAQASASLFDKPAAVHRRRALKAAGCTHVKVVKLHAGELPQPVT